jgi:hypothetical protein
MSGKQPPSWFGKAGVEDEKQKQADAERRAALLRQLPDLLKRQQDRGRAQKFQPYLLIRSVLGDRGDRPINVPFWESPDIWTAAGAPAATPAVPPDHGGVVSAGQPNTVYAHVWNLGFAPLAGVRVEFYWFNPSLGINGANANLIGIARIELGGRGSPGSHRLVKCPQPWVPVMQNGGHECLVVRVSGFGDPVGNNEWAPWLNRHVGQRNVSVVTAGSGIGNLIHSLNLTRLANARIELVQVGHAQANLALTLVAPGLRASPAVETHLLGELGADGRVALPTARAPSPAMLAPVHALAHGLTAPAPRVLDRPAIVALSRTVTGLAPPAAATAAAATADVADLLGGFHALHPGAPGLAPPARGEAHVVRIASYQGAQLVGGYTLVIAGGP